MVRSGLKTAERRTGLILNGLQVAPGEESWHDRPDKLNIAARTQVFKGEKPFG